AATKFSHLTPDGLIDIVSGGRMGAGANNIIDLVAAKMIQRSSLSMIVIDGTKPENIPDALIRGKFDGTVVSDDKKQLLPL
ncbi:MAG: UMP kinase, partial [Methanomicrobium sp.]|nr:UMP kinase [Methanomicrobium sp.]